MFNTGDCVVHPKHGSGVVAKRRSIQYHGDEREFFCIELVDGRGSVMIPLERLEEAGLREPIKDTSLIQQIMEMPPEPLVDDAHVRQSAIEEKLVSGDVRLIIQVVRDLAWRETVQHLSPTDRKIKEGAIGKLMQELAMNRLLVVTNVRHSIENIIQQSMQLHLAAQGYASAVASDS